MNQSSPRLYNKGLTLVELMAATLVIAILAAGMFGAFTASQRFLHGSRERAQAFNLAVEALDRFRANCAYADMADGNLNADAEINKIALGAEMSAAGAVITYEAGSEPGAGSYKPVTITVEWE